MVSVGNNSKTPRRLRVELPPERIPKQRQLPGMNLKLAAGEVDKVAERNPKGLDLIRTPIPIQTLSKAAAIRA